MTFDLKAAVAAAAKQAPQSAEVFPAVVPGRVLHLDGDYLAYFAAGNDDMEPGSSRQNAFNRIELTRLRTGSESVILHLSASGCTKANRFIIATVKPYQGQRNAARKPKNWAYLREVFESYEGHLFRPKVWPHREADDGMAYCAEIADIAISTRDKDMRMLPGLHINWMTCELTHVPRDPRGGAVWDVTGTDGLQYGLKWLYLQLLQGDTADNIPGLPKLNGVACGEARATKYLAPAKDRDTAYGLIATAYGEHYGTEWADALAEQAALLWLRNDASADLRNVLSAFPDCPDLRDAIYRLEGRVIQELNNLAKIKSV